MKGFEITREVAVYEDLELNISCLTMVENNGSGESTVVIHSYGEGRKHIGSAGILSRYLSDGGIQDSTLDHDRHSDCEDSGQLRLKEKPTEVVRGNLDACCVTIRQEHCTQFCICAGLRADERSLDFDEGDAPELDPA